MENGAGVPLRSAAAATAMTRANAAGYIGWLVWLFPAAATTAVVAGNLASTCASPTGGNCGSPRAPSERLITLTSGRRTKAASLDTIVPSLARPSPSSAGTISTVAVVANRTMMPVMNIE